MPAMLTPLTPLLGGARRAIPHASVLFLLVLSLTPLPFMGALGAGALHITPPLALIGVAFWAARRPDRFGIIAAFVIGLLQDLLLGAPPGLTAFLYALLHRLAFRQHHTLRALAFPLAWGVFGLAMSTVILLQWIVWSWLGDLLLPPRPFLLQAIAGLALFPITVWCLARIQPASTNHTP